MPWICFLHSPLQCILLLTITPAYRRFIIGCFHRFLCIKNGVILGDEQKKLAKNILLLRISIILLRIRNMYRLIIHRKIFRDVFRSDQSQLPLSQKQQEESNEILSNSNETIVYSNNIFKKNYLQFIFDYYYNYYYSLFLSRYYRNYYYQSVPCYCDILFLTSE